MTDYARQVQAAIYTALEAALTIPIYDGVTPQDTSYPLAIMQMISISDDSTKTEHGQEFIFRVEVWSRSSDNDFGEVFDNLKIVYDTLHHKGLSTATGNLWFFQFEDGDFFMDANGITRRGYHDYRIMVEST